jgi:probable LLM family oxidoreductase
MEIGIDSFAGAMRFPGLSKGASHARSMQLLLDRMVFADEKGLDVFGIGEHHREEFLDSAPSVILAAAAARTKNIRLTSAVTVLSAADPVRVFQQFATLDLISGGRAEMVVGRGSFSESFPLFGFDFRDYDDLFIEKLDLLLQLREQEEITWRGRFRPPLDHQKVYPRPLQDNLPVWIGVGGTPQSFARAGMLGLPLMVAIIGGETHRFKPLIDLYRRMGAEAGHAPEKLKVGIHSLGYVAQTTEKAHADYWPGYEVLFNKIGRERGWGKITRDHFEDLTGPTGALLVGNPEEVAEKILRHSQALGGISRLTFQMVSADLPQDKLLSAIELIGDKVRPAVRKAVGVAL